MKKLLVLLCAAGMLAVTSCNNSSKVGDLKTPEDSLSYYLGLNYGSGMKEQMKQGPDSAKFNKDEFLKGLKLVMDADTANVSYLSGIQMGSQLKQLIQQAKAQNKIDLDPKILYASVAQAVNSDSAAMDPQKAQETIMNLVNKIQADKNKEVSSKNEKEGKDYLDRQMKADKSIKTTASGLAYKVVKEGTGAKYAESDSVHVKYTGTLPNGEKFDSSNGQAITFTPANVVPGFREALLMMSPGAHYILYIPGNLAYGEQGQPYGNIGPNQMLIFDVETVAGK